MRMVLLLLWLEIVIGSIVILGCQMNPARQLLCCVLVLVLLTGCDFTGQVVCGGCICYETLQFESDMELGQWVIWVIWVIFHVRVTGSSF